MITNKRQFTLSSSGEKNTAKLILMKFKPKVSRMKKYAELHGNMQKYRIKSLYGNTMEVINNEHLKHLNKLTEVSATMTKAFENNQMFQQLAEQTEKLAGMFKVGNFCPSLR